MFEWNAQFIPKYTGAVSPETNKRIPVDGAALTAKCSVSSVRPDDRIEDFQNIDLVLLFPYPTKFVPSSEIVSITNQISGETIHVGTANYRVISGNKGYFVTVSVARSVPRRPLELFSDGDSVLGEGSSVLSG